MILKHKKQQPRKVLHKGLWQGLLLGLLISLVTTVSSALAVQPPPDIADTEEQNRHSRQAAEERQQREQQKDVFLQKSSKAIKDTLLPDETPSFVIRTLQLEGNRRNQFFWLQAMLDQYKGRRIGKEGINLIVKRVTNELIHRGYVTTRIVIPEQDLTSGTLRLSLVPGVIRNIKFASPEHSGNWHNAFPTRPGDILNLRNLEQGLEQLKRVPSQDADFKIMPGEKPGESDIVISMTKKNNARAVFSLDDSGSKETGKLQSSVTLAFDNPFSVNDLFNVSFNKDADQESSLRGTDDYSLYYSFPSGNWTFTLSTQHHNYHQTVPGINQTLPYFGDSDTHEFTIDKLLHRDQTSKTHLEFSISKKQSRNFAGDTEIGVQHKNTTAAQLALSHRQYFGKKTLDLRLAYKRGVPWFGAQSEPDNSAPNTATTRYNLWTLEANYNTPVALGKIEGKYSTTLRVQNTNNVLYAVDYFSIGNRYTVRGFDGEQTLAAERGYFLRNELSVPLGKSGHEFYLGLDYGQVRGFASKDLPGKELAGAAIGFRGSIQGINYEVFSAWALKKPQGLQTDTPAIGFQFMYQI